MKTKRCLAVLLATVLLLCAGCTQSRRFGIQELSRRLGSMNELYAFSLEGAALSNGFYHIPFSVLQEEDLLLSCKEDADGQLLQILLTAEKTTAPTADFIDFSLLLTQVFFGVGEHKAAEIVHTAGLTDESVLFTDCTGTASEERYSFTFFSTPLSITAILQYDDAIR